MLRLTQLGRRMRQARTIKGWSLDKLAEKSDLTKSFLSECERSLKYPRLETLDRICKILGKKLI